MPPTKYGNSVIFQKLKETARDMMMDFDNLEGTQKVWADVNKWYVHNFMSVPWSEFPAVFFVVPRYREEYHSITRKKRWVVTLQIEYYFGEYNETEEEVCLEWIEELSRMIRTMPLHPYVNQPDPNVFKVLDWILDDARIDYFVEDNHLLMGAVISTSITLLDCRDVGV